MKRFQDQRTKRVVQLSEDARAAKTQLASALDVAERVLVLSGTAQKLETPEEKAFMFLGRKSPSLEGEAGTSLLERHWEKFNKVNNLLVPCGLLYVSVPTTDLFWNSTLRFSLKRW